MGRRRRHHENFHESAHATSQHRNILSRIGMPYIMDMPPDITNGATAGRRGEHDACQWRIISIHARCWRAVIKTPTSASSFVIFTPTDMRLAVRAFQYINNAAPKALKWRATIMKMPPFIDKKRDMHLCRRGDSVNVPASWETIAWGVARLSFTDLKYIRLFTILAITHYQTLQSILNQLSLDSWNISTMMPWCDASDLAASIFHNLFQRATVLLSIFVTPTHNLLHEMSLSAFAASAKMAILKLWGVNNSRAVNHSDELRALL